MAGVRAAVASPRRWDALFLLARDNGVPLYPVEERPVPRSTVAGEEAWPTQPFSHVPPPPLVPEKFSVERDAWGATPEDKKWCAARLRGGAVRGHLHAAVSRGDGLFRATSAGNCGGSRTTGTEPPDRAANRSCSSSPALPRKATRVCGDRCCHRMAASRAPDRHSLREYREFLAPQSGSSVNPHRPTGDRSWRRPRDRQVALGRAPGRSRGFRPCRDPNRWGSVTWAVPSCPAEVSPSSPQRWITSSGVRRGDGPGAAKWELPAGGQATPMTIR